MMDIRARLEYIDTLIRHDADLEDGDIDYGYEAGAETLKQEIIEEFKAKDERIAELEAYADKLAAGLPDGILPKDVEVLREANAHMATQILDAVNFILKWGVYDGEHHKQWTLDQVLRVLLEKDYSVSVGEDWETGVAP